MSTEDAKAYLSSREVPRLFECLMTGLMFHRPNDHIQYLVECLEKVKKKGQAEMTWNMFVEVRSAKTPLPPITPDNGKRPTSRGRVTPKEEARAMTPHGKSTPLPPIGSSSHLGSGAPNVPVVFIMGGPGSGKSQQAAMLAEKHPGWVNVCLGDLMRKEMANNAADEKWMKVKELVGQGDLAPEDVTLMLLQQVIMNNTEANGFIIQGFPRDMAQAMAFEAKVSRVDAVFLLDCEEAKLTENVLARASNSIRRDDTPAALACRLATFKEKTLPVLKTFDDAGKLYIVDGDQEADSCHDELSIIFETLLQNLDNGRIPSPPCTSRPASGRKSRKSPTAPSDAPTPSITQDVDTAMMVPAEVEMTPVPEIKVKDTGRKDGLPTAPIIFMAGGPGSGKGTQAKKIMARYPDICHLSIGDILRKEISDKGSADEKWSMITKLMTNGEMAPSDVTEELLCKAMKDNPNAKAFLVEGYPRDALQYEDFNRNIGGHNFTILLDCEAKYLQDRLMDRGSGGYDRIDDNVEAIKKKVSLFARCTIPLLKSIDDEGKLITIDGDRDESEIFYDIVKSLDFSLYGIELEGGAKADDAATVEEEKQPIVEEMMVQGTAVVTGDTDNPNPEFSASLDKADEPTEGKLPKEPTFTTEAPEVEKAAVLVTETTTEAPAS